MVFVNSMSDLFWEAIPEDYRDKIVDVIEQTPQHQYQVLTKRPEILLQYSERRKLPGNFWAGVTIENQDCAFRLDILRRVKAEIRFISAEPMLGPLNLDLSDIQWMIAGGESGGHLFDEKIRRERALVDFTQGKWMPREDRVDWVRSVRDQCREYEVKFFHKQWGGATPKSAGRLLDGKTHDDFPRLPQDGRVNPLLAMQLVKT